MNEIPCIRAKSWAVFDANAGKLISGNNHYCKRQMASLTKMMTLYVSF